MHATPLHNRIHAVVENAVALELVSSRTASYFRLIEIRNVFSNTFVEFLRQLIRVRNRTGVLIAAAAVAKGVHDLSDVQFVDFLEELLYIGSSCLGSVRALVLDDQDELNLSVGQVSVDTGFFEGKQKAGKVVIVVAAVGWNCLFLTVESFCELLQPIETFVHSKPAPCGGRRLGSAVRFQSEQDGFVIAIVAIILFREKFSYVQG